MRRARGDVRVVPDGARHRTARPDCPRPPQGAPLLQPNPRVAALVPTACGPPPILPLHQELHQQWRSYGGFTFAFKDYVEADVLYRFDTPAFVKLLENVDPAFHLDRLSHLPKLSVVSSDDEFMQLDWTSDPGASWQDLPGETHMLVVPNSEHSLATGLPELLGTLSAFLQSVAAGEPPSARRYNDDQSADSSGLAP